MKFPNAPAAVAEEYSIAVGEGIVTFLVQKPNTLQRFEDEDNRLRGFNFRTHRLRACVVNWVGLEDEHGPVGFSIYKLQLLCDAFPQLLDELVKIVDPLFE